MKSRMRLLVIGLAVVTVSIAACSSTTAGSTGAVQNEATLAASPSAASEDPDSGPALLGSTSSADVCNSGLAYACGDTGPGGGTVFYASSTPFSCGANLTTSCNFLEVAPNLWNPSVQTSCKTLGSPCGGSSNNQTTSDWTTSGRTITGPMWCAGAVNFCSVTAAEGWQIGTGYANTMAIVAALGSTGQAAYDAQSYTGGGMTDWYLPSIQELTALYQYPNRAAIGGFNSGYYWSSTQDDSHSTMARVVEFNGRVIGGSLKMNYYGGVRPIRAF
jgi:Protein of unknown function (DUF1566)